MIALRDGIVHRPYSRPLKQYVHTLHGSNPMDAMRPSSLWNRSVVKFCILRISSTISAYLQESGLAYSSNTSHGQFSPSLS